MIAKTRRFVVTSSAVLLVGLCVGLLAYYGGWAPGAQARQAGPGELAYVPADAVVVAYADVRGIMASDLRQRLRSMMPPGERGQEEFRARTGIDVENDIDYVVACALPEGGRQSGLAILRGRFDTVRLEALAAEHGATMSEYNGVRIVQWPPRRQRERDGEGIAPALALVEPGLIVAGDEAAVRQGVDARAAGRSVSDGSDLIDLIEGLETGASAWVVGRFDELASRAQLPDGIAARFPSVTWFTASARVGGEVSGLVRAEAQDEQAARNLHDVANGFLAMARLQAGNFPALQPLADAVTLGLAGKVVELSFTVPAQALDALPLRPRPQREAP
jgi:hypothetical protein